MEIAAKTEKRNIAVIILRAAAALAAAGAFAIYYLKHRGGYAWHQFIAPFVSLALFAALFICAAPSFVRVFKGGGDIPAPYESKKAETKRDLLRIGIAALIIHFAAIFIGVLIFRVVDGFAKNLDFATLFHHAWMKANTDAQHYLDIAEHWYVNEGNEALFIVFFPMFPMLVRGLNVIFHNGFASALVLNAIATVGAACMTYLALLPALGRKRAKAGAFVYMLLPGAIFMNSPMTEPLFMLFTACFFYFLNNKRFLLAGAFTALAGFTRSLGVLLAAPLALVGMGELVRRIRAKENAGAFAARLIAALVISTFGTLAYLWINYAVFGDPLKFFEFQWSNWHQKACPFFDTARYTVKYGIDALKDPEKLFSLWLPQVLAIFGALMIMIPAARRLPASHTVYFLPYFAVAVGCTWLLSSVRYLSAALPIAAAVALPCEKKGGRSAVFAALIVCYLVYMYMYMMRWGVY